MKLSRDSWLGLAIVALLVVVMSAVVARQSSVTENNPYLSTSAAPGGVLAFKLWLGELGFSVVEEELSTYDPPAVNTIFIIQPFWSVTDTDWVVLDRFVENGGTLVLAGDNYAAASAMGHYKFSQTLLGEAAQELTLATPLLTSPVVVSNVALATDVALFPQRADYVPLLLADGEPVVASFKQGRGRVILASNPALFTNKSLKNDSVAVFALNLIALTSKGSVWFDEWHHGIQAQRIVGPDQWLQRTPGGHALLFALGVVFVGLLLQGKAFGRPVPLLHEVKRRGPLEHVTAIANLKRKAGHRAEVLQQYHQRLKRQLGARYRLDPSLPDVDYVNALAQLNSSIRKDELLAVLQRLARKRVSEGELVKLAAEAAKWMKE